MLKNGICYGVFLLTMSLIQQAPVPAPIVRGQDNPPNQRSTPSAYIKDFRLQGVESSDDTNVSISFSTGRNSSHFLFHSLVGSFGLDLKEEQGKYTLSGPVDREAVLRSFVKDVGARPGVTLGADGITTDSSTGKVSISFSMTPEFERSVAKSLFESYGLNVQQNESDRYTISAGPSRQRALVDFVDTFHNDYRFTDHIPTPGQGAKCPFCSDDPKHSTALLVFGCGGCSIGGGFEAPLDSLPNQFISAKSMHSSTPSGTKPAGSIEINPVPIREAILVFLRARCGDKLVVLQNTPLFLETQVEGVKGLITQNGHNWEKFKIQVFFASIPGEKTVTFRVIVDGQYSAGIGQPTSDSDYKDLEPTYSSKLSDYVNMLVTDLRMHLGVKN